MLRIRRDQALLEQHDDIQLEYSKKRRRVLATKQGSKIDEDDMCDRAWESICAVERDFEGFEKAAIEEWGRKTTLSAVGSTKFKILNRGNATVSNANVLFFLNMAVSAGIMEQVEAVMQDKERLYRRVRTPRNKQKVRLVFAFHERTNAVPSLPFVCRW